MTQSDSLFPNDSMDIDTSSVKLLDLFDMRELQQIQDAFSLATGVSALITDADGMPITRPSNFTGYCSLIRSTSEGLARCMQSDAKLGLVNPNGLIFGRCFSGGIYDGGTGIMISDRQIGNWLIGQVSDEMLDEQAVRGFGVLLGLC